MDVLTIGISAAVSTFCTICVMICFYKLWILPYLTNLTNSVPIQVKEFVGPFIDEKIAAITTDLSGKIDDMKISVRQTSNRFNRTLKQAENYLGNSDVDLTDEEATSNLVDRMTDKYGAAAAINAFSKVLTSLKANQEPPKKAQVTDGWDS